MVKSHNDLIKFALANNKTISINNGNEWVLIKSTNTDQIISNLSRDNISIIRIHEGNDFCQAWVNLNEYVNSVISFTCNEFFNDWTNQPKIENTNIISGFFNSLFK